MILLLQPSVKNFDNLKNETDIKRTYAHSSETLKGKIFVAFISLIVRSYMLKTLKHFKKATNFTQKKIFTELDKIKVLELNQKSKPQLLNPLTKTQRELLCALNISEPDLCRG